MKKLLLTLGLTALTLVSAHADGTINPIPLGAFRIDGNGDVIPARNATPADGLELHLFYGPAGIANRNELIHFPQFAIIDGSGSWSGLPTILAIPGTDVGQTISMQFRVCSPFGLFAETLIKQITLGPETGPGTVVWQTSSFTNPNRFSPLVGPVVRPGEVCVPEPSTLALGGLACAFLLLRARKTFVRR
jgi:PEP-CTERM motif